MSSPINDNLGCVTQSLKVPQAFLDRLAPGGRLFAVVGDPPVMEATVIGNAERAALSSVKLFETMLKPLVNAPQPARFRF